MYGLFTTILQSVRYTQCHLHTDIIISHAVLTEYNVTSLLSDLAFTPFSTLLLTTSKGNVTIEKKALLHQKTTYKCFTCILQCITLTKLISSLIVKMGRQDYTTIYVSQKHHLHNNITTVYHYYIYSLIHKVVMMNMEQF
jgi:hypothetical protein